MFKYICHVFSLTPFCAIFNLIISSPSANNLLQILQHTWHAESWATLPRPPGTSVAVVHSPLLGSVWEGMGNATERAKWKQIFVADPGTHITPSLWQVEMWECFFLLGPLQSRWRSKRTTGIRGSSQGTSYFQDHWHIKGKPLNFPMR